MIIKVDYNKETIKWLIEAMQDQALFRLLPTYKEILNSYKKDFAIRVTQPEYFINRESYLHIALIIDLFEVYLQKNNIDALKFLSEFSLHSFRRTFFDDYPAVRECFVQLCEEVLKKGESYEFNFKKIDKELNPFENGPFLTLLANNTKRYKECIDIEKYLKRLKAPPFTRLLPATVQNFTVTIGDTLKNCFDLKKVINAATKNQFNEFRDRYYHDKRFSNLELNSNGPEKKNCFLNEECLLQPDLFSIHDAFKSGTAAQNKLELSATQEFFKKTMHAIVENKKEKLPNVLVNYWGTGTGKTLGSLLFLCAKDITDCFIMVHSADMISSFMSDFQSDIGRFVIDQELGIKGTVQTWEKKNSHLKTDSTAKYELKNGKDVVKTIYFMVYGYLFNKSVYKYRGKIDNEDAHGQKSLVQFHDTLWNFGNTEKKFALIMDEAHSLRNSKGTWYENVIAFFTDDTQNQRISSELLPIQRTLLMTATLAANQIDQATHVLDLGCILTNSKDHATRKIDYVPTALQKFFEWCENKVKITKEDVADWENICDKTLSYIDEVLSMLKEKIDTQEVEFSVVKDYYIELNERFTFSETYESMRVQNDDKKKEEEKKKKVIADRIKNGRKRKQAELKKAEAAKIAESITNPGITIDEDDDLMQPETKNIEDTIAEDIKPEDDVNEQSENDKDSDFEIDKEDETQTKQKRKNEPTEIRKSSRIQRKNYTNQDDGFIDDDYETKQKKRRHKSNYDTNRTREISARMNKDMEGLKEQFETEKEINGQVYYTFLLDLNQTMKDSGVAIIRGLGGDEGMPEFDGKRAFLAPTTTKENRGLLFWANTPYEIEMSSDEFVKLMKYIDACKKYDGVEYPAESSAYRKITSAYFDMDNVKLPIFYFKSEQNRQRPKGKKKKKPAQDEQLEAKIYKYCDLGTFAADAAMKSMFVSGDKSKDYRYYLFKNILRRAKESNESASMFIVQDSKKIEIKKEMKEGNKKQKILPGMYITFTKSDGTEIEIGPEELSKIFRGANKPDNKNADDEDADPDAVPVVEKNTNEGVDEDIHFDSPKQKELIKNFSEQVFDKIDKAFLLSNFQDKKMQSVVASVVHLAKNKENGPIAVFGEHTDGCDSIAHFIFRMVEQGFSIQEHVKTKGNGKPTKIKAKKNPAKKGKGKATTEEEETIETEDVENKLEYKTMVAYTGTSDDYSALKGVEARRAARDTFNSEENVDGKNIKIMILTAAGSTGLTLKNTHIMIDMHVPEDVVIKQQKQGRTVRRTVSEKFYAGFTRAKIAEHNNKLPRVTEYSFLSTFPEKAIWPPEPEKKEDISKPGAVNQEKHEVIDLSISDDEHFGDDAEAKKRQIKPSDKKLDQSETDNKGSDADTEGEEEEEEEDGDEDMDENEEDMSGEESGDGENDTDEDGEEESGSETDHKSKKPRTETGSKARFTGSDAESENEIEDDADDKSYKEDESEKEEEDDDGENYGKGEEESDDDDEDAGMENNKPEKSEKITPSGPTPQLTFDQKTMKSLRSKVAIGNFQSLAFTSVALNAKDIVKDLGESSTLVIPLGESLF